jgi:predicted adenine nucleotide alpha hydrolase (AANH) superfamily ATPase
LEILKGEGIRFSVLFENSNIQPAEEYRRRHETFCTLADNLGVEHRQGAYEPAAWDDAISTHAGVYPLVTGEADYEDYLSRRMARCGACYAFRFERVAACAARSGFDAIATTLSISPYQFTDRMAAELEAAAERHGLESAFVDYRGSYRDSVQRSRELGLYRQNYCGCRYSKAEAALERTARKKARGQKHA